MFTLTPIPEDQARGETKQLYQEIKLTFGVANIPLIFQYFALFPTYLQYIWQQISQNIADTQYRILVGDIYQFARDAIGQIYTPSIPTQLILENLRTSAEIYELNQFVHQSSQLNASLYLLSLSLRESVKGTHLGIKKLGTNSTQEESIFTDVSEGYSPSQNENSNPSAPFSQSIVAKNRGGITTSYTAKFFHCIKTEMDRLIKQEEYLSRRVELERFSVNKLFLLPHPLESSVKTIFHKTSDDPNYPELLYLLSELFPTQAPFKLMATTLMHHTLAWQPEAEKPDILHPILLVPADAESG